MLETTKQSIGILLNVTTYDRLSDMFTCYLSYKNRYFSTIRFDPMLPLNNHYLWRQHNMVSM